MTIVAGWPTTRAGQNRVALKVGCPACMALAGRSCAHLLTGNPCGMHAARRQWAREAVATGELDPGHDWEQRP